MTAFSAASAETLPISEDAWREEIVAEIAIGDDADERARRRPRPARGFQAPGRPGLLLHSAECYRLPTQHARDLIAFDGSEGLVFAGRDRRWGDHASADTMPGRDTS